MSGMRKKRKLRAKAEAEAAKVEAEAAAAKVEADAPETAEGDGKPEIPEGATLRRILESLLFVAEGPLTVNRLRQLTRVKSNKIVAEALEQLREEYAERGIVLYKVSGGYTFRSNALSSHWVQKLVVGKPVRLSRAQLETLAIIAYRQPITRPEIDEIRGVDSASTLRLLLERDLIRVLGKKEEPGRPLLYGSTPEFLEFFNLNDLRDLPTLREYSELTDESMALVEDTLGEEDAAATVAEVLAANANVAADSDESAEEGDGSEGDGSEGDGSEGDGSEGDGSEGDGSEGDGSEGDGSEGDGSEGDGSEGDGSEGDGSEASASEPEATDEAGADVLPFESASDNDDEQSVA